MQSRLIYAICGLIFLIISLAAVFFWDKVNADGRKSVSVPEDHPEGNIRGFFFVLWALVLSSFISFAAPSLFRLSRSVQEDLGRGQKIAFAMAALVLPAVILFLLGLGVRKRYMNWISDLNWPDEDKKH